MTKNLNNVKSIEAKVTFHGNGLINADEGENHSWFLYNKGLYATRNKNIKYAKKVFIDDKGGTKFKYKVSSDCLRHAMFEKEMAYYNASIIEVPIALYNAIATPSLIARGYMFAKKDKNESKGWSAKKTSIFNITSAIAKMEPSDKVYAEFCSKAGSRPTKDIEDEDAKSGTSIHSVETVGEYDYEAQMYIDLCEAQFISIDNLYDRCAVPFDKHNPEYKNIYFNAIKRNFNVSEAPELKNYTLGTSVMGDEFSEEGIKLTKEMVNQIVHLILDRVIDLNIRRNSNGGYMTFKSMVLTVNTEDGKSETFEVTKKEDIDSISFNYEDVYFEADPEKVRNRIDIINAIEEEAKKNKKAKKNKNENAE